MGRRAITCYILTLCLTLLPFSSYAIPEETSNTTQATTETPPGSNTRNVLIKTSSLCVGGALLGSFIPVLGSVVGCAIGGVSGWFMSRKPSTEVAANTTSSNSETIAPATPATPIEPTVNSGE